jgi:hypothetical protein
MTEEPQVKRAEVISRVLIMFASTDDLPCIEIVGTKVHSVWLDSMVVSTWLRHCCSTCDEIVLSNES